jgi:hypothetical protein
VAHAHTAAEASTLSPFVAQCSAAGASSEPLRRRSSQNTTPDAAVNSTVPRTAISCADRPRPTALPIAWLLAASPSDGSTCQMPNSADDTAVAATVPRSRRSRPHSTPRKATSSSSTVPSGMSTNAVSSACAQSRW